MGLPVSVWTPEGDLLRQVCRTWAENPAVQRVWATTLPVSRECLSPEVSWPVPFPASLTPGQPAHSQHPKTHHTPHHDVTHLPQTQADGSSRDLSELTLLLQLPSSLVVHFIQTLTRQFVRVSFHRHVALGHLQDNGQEGQGVSPWPGGRRSSGQSADLEMLLRLQKNQAGFAPQLLVFLLQFDDVVFGDR